MTSPKICPMIPLKAIVVITILSLAVYAVAFDNPADVSSLISHDCEGCHDGVIAPDIRLNHPIGIDYRWAQLRSRGKLKDITQLGSSIVLEDGRIGCLSCHSPESNIRGKLAVSNAGSRLCFSCHNS
jgi:predicted CXXCH cytochrome family protein